MAKMNMLGDANGMALRFLLFSGQVSNICHAQPLFDEVSVLSFQRRRPCKRCKWLLAEKGYDAEVLRQYWYCCRIQLVILMRSMKRKPNSGLSGLFHRP